MKFAEVFIWFGRIAVSIAVGILIFNGLEYSPRFVGDFFARIGAAAFTAFICFFLLWITTKSGAT